MNDRTSHSYRADLPGSRPDMHKVGGMSREEFKRVRCSPYIREHAQVREDSRSGEGKSNRNQRKGKRANAPELCPRF